MTTAFAAPIVPAPAGPLPVAGRRGRALRPPVARRWRPPATRRVPPPPPPPAPSTPPPPPRQRRGATGARPSPRRRRRLGAPRARPRGAPPHPPPPPGVYLVGAGPGDPSLLTLGAVRLLGAARVVLYDRLLPAGILCLAPPDATLIPVGKRPGAHTPQTDINAALVDAAAGGGVVVRLKGGDPGVYGRVAEEAGALHPTPATTVPGVTAASGVAASLGFPLTARGVAGSVRFVSGHAAAGGVGGAVLPDWGDLGGGEGGEGGWGGTTLVRVGAAGLRSPVLVVVGEVVALAGGWRAWAAADGRADVEREWAPPAERVGAGGAGGGEVERGWVPRTVPLLGDAGGVAAGG
ncbi:hypothetical protein BU14_0200s0032 [Porphyra umbilicalis]|uniref:uroporphyrinogen-III C-methyltransferase n=1 Tax=Porphyra umbilicalis TaxID=2786 RepID=A0A1X6P615_PORUM|nr:hypothetical protein BU14_0200s0032 [Porphyra umbilicalis]|eukprot:OSX76277.1 hypothetical protein BU14_0200s0032 [Porphyra umbilicalis]